MDVIVFATFEPDNAFNILRDGDNAEALTVKGTRTDVTTFPDVQEAYALHKPTYFRKTVMYWVAHQG